MKTKKKDIDLLGQLLSDKDLMQKILADELDKDELIEILQDNSQKEKPEYIVKEILKEHKIKYFRERFYIYNGKFWEAQEDRFHIAIHKLIVKVLDRDRIPYYKLLVEDSVKLLMTRVDGFKKMQTRYSVYVFTNGTLIYLKGKYEFKPAFDHRHEVRNDENPMFEYEFPEDTSGIENVTEVFEEWGVDPKQLYEIMTYSLFQKGNPYNISFYLRGVGRNGKSQFLRLLEELLPKNALTHLSPAKITGDKDGSECLERSYINSVSEVSLVKFDMTTFKNILGDEPIQVNPKFKSPVTIYPTCKFILSSNEGIHVRSTREGDLRRFIQIPFDKQFETNYAFFEKRLKPYVGSVFAYCLEQSKSLWASKLYLNQEYLDTTRKEILGMSSTIYTFIKEFEVVYSDNPVDCRHVYAAYVKWTNENGQHNVNSKNFWKEIAELVRGYKECEKKHYRHISWNEELKELLFDVGGFSAIFTKIGKGDGRESTEVPRFVTENVN